MTNTTRAEGGTAPGASAVDLGKLFEEVNEKLTGYLHHHLGVPEYAAVEIVQETFLKAHRSGYKDGAASPTTWIFTLATRKAKTYLRDEGRQNRGRAADPEVSEQILDEKSSASRKILRTQMVQFLVDTLEPQLLRCFVLHEADGLTIEHIAEIEEISKAQALGRIKQARKLIAAKLQQLGSREQFAQLSLVKGRPR